MNFEQSNGLEQGDAQHNDSEHRRANSVNEICIVIPQYIAMATQRLAPISVYCHIILLNQNPI